MKPNALATAALFTFTLPTFMAAEPALAARRVEVENPIFGYTHMLPSPFTVPGGMLLVGTDVVLGVTDFFQVGTNVIRDFYQSYNGNIKIALLDAPGFAFALTGGIEHYNYRNFDSTNPDVWVTSYQPGAVVAIGVLPTLGWFVGSNLNFTDQPLITDGIVNSGYFRGATLQSDLAWAYYPPTKKKGLGNVVAVGTTYDVNYKIFGVGLSHYWPGFRLGVHYYVNADENKFLPLISGGTVVYF